MKGEDRPTIAFRVTAETRALLESLAAREGVKLSRIADTLLAAAVRERLAQFEAAGGQPSRRTGRATTKGVERVRQKR